MLDSIEVMCMRRRILGLRCCLNSSMSMSEMERKIVRNYVSRISRSIRVGASAKCHKVIWTKSRNLRLCDSIGALATDAKTS